MRRLLLLRHAKAVPGDGQPDEERPLADRGRRDAAAVGRWLAASGTPVDLVLCSPAVRTRQTWQYAAEQLPAPPPVIYDERCYAASAGQLAAVVAEVADRGDEVLVVGHNPAIEDLALRLVGSGEPDALARMRAKFPTSGCAVLSVGPDWQEGSRARLLHFAVPRG